MGDVSKLVFQLIVVDVRNTLGDGGCNDCSVYHSLNHSHSKGKLKKEHGSKKHKKRKRRQQESNED